MSGIYLTDDQLKEISFMRMGQKIFYFQFVAERTNKGVIITEK